MCINGDVKFTIIERIEKDINMKSIIEKKKKKWLKSKNMCHLDLIWNFISQSLFDSVNYPYKKIKQTISPCSFEKLPLEINTVKKSTQTNKQAGQLTNLKCIPPTPNENTLKQVLSPQTDRYIYEINQRHFDQTTVFIILLPRGIHWEDRNKITTILVFELASHQRMTVETS